MKKKMIYIGNIKYLLKFLLHIFFIIFKWHLLILIVLYIYRFSECTNDKSKNKKYIDKNVYVR